MRHTNTLCALLLIALPVLQCKASEKDELALVMRQLEQLQAGLDRARVIANQNQDARVILITNRPSAIRSVPGNRLTAEEEQQIQAVSHQPAYANLPPSQIVPRLADKGIYVASESTFYRVLRRYGEAHRRGRQRTGEKARPATTWKATEPNQVWM